MVKQPFHWGKKPGLLPDPHPFRLLRPLRFFGKEYATHEYVSHPLVIGLNLCLEGKLRIPGTVEELQGVLADAEDRFEKAKTSNAYNSGDISRTGMYIRAVKLALQIAKAEREAIAANSHPDVERARRKLEEAQATVATHEFRVRAAQEVVVARKRELLATEERVKKLAAN